MSNLLELAIALRLREVWSGTDWSDAVALDPIVDDISADDLDALVLPGNAAGNGPGQTLEADALVEEVFVDADLQAAALNDWIHRRPPCRRRNVMMSLVPDGENVTELARALDLIWTAPDPSPCPVTGLVVRVIVLLPTGLERGTAGTKWHGPAEWILRRVTYGRGARAVAAS